MNRVLFYTHNSIGLGHAVRAASLITGVRRHRPDTDFLVISGGSAPQIFLQEGVEVVKLPGVRRDMDDLGFHPRLLPRFELEGLMRFRSGVIKKTLDWFKPSTVFVEHALTGLLGEAMPVFQRKLDLAGTPDEFVLAHVSRGVKVSSACPAGRPLDPAGRNPAELYDFFFVLEEEEYADIKPVGPSRAQRDKLRFLGRIACRTPEELPERRAVLAGRGFDSSPVVISLGRHGPVAEMTGRVLEAVSAIPQLSHGGSIIALDPYLPAETVREVRRLAQKHGAMVSGFAPGLVELISAASLVVCRGGYNSVNEVLLTGVKALIIPERHPSGEQEARASLLSGPGLAVMDQERALGPDLDKVLARLMNEKTSRERVPYDRYEIGRRIVREIENFVEKRG